MGLSNGKITIPFTFDAVNGDVQRCLGYYNSSLKAVIQNADINMWSKFKPVIYASDITSNQMNADGTWKTTSNWWRSSDGNFGITVNVNTYKVGNGSGTVTDDNLLPNTLNRLAANIDGGNHGWGYDRPYGGANSPYRINDFNGYNHNAPKPVRQVNVTDEVSMQPSHQWTQMVEMLTPPGGAIADRDYVLPSDFVSISLNLGFVIYKKDSNGDYQVMAWTTGAVWNGFSVYSDDGMTIHPQAGKCEAHFKDQGTYWVLPVYFSHSMSQPADGMSVNNVGVYIVPVPGVGFYRFRCYSTGTGNIAAAVISNRQIRTTWRYRTAILFDATDTENYDGGTFDEVQAAIVNEAWDESTYPSATSSDAPWRQSATGVTVPAGGTITWISEEDMGLVQLVSGHTWKIIVRMKQSGIWTSWFVTPLMQPYIPGGLDESEN